MRLAPRPCLAGALAVAASTAAHSDRQPDADGVDYLSPASKSLSAECSFYSRREAKVDAFHRNLAAAEQENLARLRPITISLCFHVVSSVSLNSTQRRVKDAQLQEQLRVLNDSYKQARISFALTHVSWTVNPDWALATNMTTQDRMMKTLHQGGFETLNLFILEDNGGFCSCEAVATIFGEYDLPGRPRRVPEDVGMIYRELYGDGEARKMIEYLEKGELPPGITPETANRTQLDGCQIDASRLPNSGVSDGKRIVHEVGHWLGLLHTFYGGCDLENDFVADTPAMLPQMGCGTDAHTPDSCPGLPGLDPVQNFMSYSEGSMMTEFTPGQVKRMHTFWKLYRAGETGRRR